MASSPSQHEWGNTNTNPIEKKTLRIDLRSYPSRLACTYPTPLLADPIAHRAAAIAAVVAAAPAAASIVARRGRAAVRRSASSERVY